MPGIIDPETINASGLPGVWSPVQWELTEKERIQEIHNQATASLLAAVDLPEAMLRLALNETAIERTFDPPKNYDPALQGEWDDQIITFQFKRPIELIKVDREAHSLHVEYRFDDLGYWGIEIEPEKITIQRI